jgi:hypothetical protein
MVRNGVCTTSWSRHGRYLNSHQTATEVPSNLSLTVTFFYNPHRTGGSTLRLYLNADTP